LAKHDSGKYRTYGAVLNGYMAAWRELGGPIIGFQYEGVVGTSWP